MQQAARPSKMGSWQGMLLHVGMGKAALIEGTTVQCHEPL